MEYKPTPVDTIDAAMQEALELLDVATTSISSRESALTKTNLEQAIMWYRKGFYKEAAGFLINKEPGELVRDNSLNKRKLQ
jgi:hypothetical protein